MGKSGGRRNKSTVVTANAVSQPSLNTEPKSKPKLEPGPSLESLKQNQNENVTVTQRQLKLVHDHDIRLVQIPINCTFRELKDTVKIKFPSLDSVLIKFNDNDGDSVTITSTGELRIAESIVDGNGSTGILKLDVIKVSPEQEPRLIEEKHKDCVMEEKNVVEIDDWLHEFAKLFCLRVGIESAGGNKNIDLHELGVDFCSEALEETLISDEAQDLFDKASFKFQEVAALAFFNWGNVHMCAARKMVRLDENENENRDLVMNESEFDFVKEKYYLAREKYERAVVIKPDFYEGLLAIGQQQFELAKLHWFYGMANKIDLGKDTLWLFDIAEEKMKAANEMWEKLEEEKLGEQGSVGMRSQIHLFWGNMLFERSQVEFKLGMSDWKRRLDSSVERFKIAGASAADVSTVLKKHYSNGNAREGEVKASQKTQNLNPIKFMK